MSTGWPGSPWVTRRCGRPTASHSEGPRFRAMISPPPTTSCRSAPTSWAPGSPRSNSRAPLPRRVRWRTAVPPSSRSSDHACRSPAPMRTSGCRRAPERKWPSSWPSPARSPVAREAGRRRAYRLSSLRSRWRRLRLRRASTRKRSGHSARSSRPPGRPSHSRRTCPDRVSTRLRYTWPSLCSTTSAEPSDRRFASREARAAGPPRRTRRSEPWRLSCEPVTTARWSRPA